jgi:hypothetical protein
MPEQWYRLIGQEQERAPHMCPQAAEAGGCFSFRVTNEQNEIEDGTHCKRSQLCPSYTPHPLCNLSSCLSMRDSGMKDHSIIFAILIVLLHSD